jgi:hypothetical protein
MATNTLPLPGLVFSSTPTRHISSTRATDAVAKLRYAQHQADEESRQLIARLRDEAEADSKASTHRCIHQYRLPPLVLPPTLLERGDKPTAIQLLAMLMLIVGFAIAAVLSIHDGVMAQHPQLIDGGTMATSVVEWRDGEVVK